MNSLEVADSSSPSDMKSMEEGSSSDIVLDFQRGWQCCAELVGGEADSQTDMRSRFVYLNITPTAIKGIEPKNFRSIKTVMESSADMH